MLCAAEAAAHQHVSERPVRALPAPTACSFLLSIFFCCLEGGCCFLLLVWIGARCETTGSLELNMSMMNVPSLSEMMLRTWLCASTCPPSRTCTCRTWARNAASVTQDLAMIPFPKVVYLCQQKYATNVCEPKSEQHDL